MPKWFQESTWSIHKAFWGTSHAETEPPTARRVLYAVATAQPVFANNGVHHETLSLDNFVVDVAAVAMMSMRGVQ